MLEIELFVPRSYVVRVGDASQAVIFLTRGAAERHWRAQSADADKLTRECSFGRRRDEQGMRRNSLPSLDRVLSTPPETTSPRSNSCSWDLSEHSSNQGPASR